MSSELTGMAQAESLLEDLGFDTLPIKPLEVANYISDDSHKIVVEAHPFDSEQILGTAVGNDRASLIYVNSNIPHDGRYNFTLAHELGHVCMHIMPGIKQRFECGKNQIYSPFDDPIEQEANGFASGLLMPERLINNLTDGDINWSNIRSIETCCETSLEAAFRRMIGLSRDPAALVIHKSGKFKRFVSSDSFSAYIERAPLSPEQISQCTVVTEDGFPSKLDTVDAIDWVNPSIRHENLERIYASSIKLENEITYTILRYDDDCFADASR